MPAIKKKDPMGNYAFSDKEFEAARWCIKNNIVVSVHPSKIPNQWHLDVILNKKSNITPMTFGPIEIWKKLYEYYLYYFNKYKKDEKR